MEKIYKTIAKQKKHLEKLGYNVVYIGLYGSQNYNLHDEESDIDVRAIIVPTLEDIISRKKTSKKYSTEFGDIDVKDLLTYYEVVAKGNFSFIEPIQTQYFIGDKKIRDIFKDIKVNLKSVKGAMYEKAKAFTHRYPSKKEEFEKWGFDPKQLHHIFRLINILRLKDDTKSFIVHEGLDRSYFLSIKRNENNICQLMGFDENTKKEKIEKFIKEVIENEELIPKDYVYESIDLDEKITKYLLDYLKVDLFNKEIGYARQYRTFGGNIPKKDKDKFPVLKEYENEDISYVIYESLEIL